MYLIPWTAPVLSQIDLNCALLVNEDTTLLKLLQTVEAETHATDHSLSQFYYWRTQALNTMLNQRHFFDSILVSYLCE